MFINVRAKMDEIAIGDIVFFPQKRILDKGGRTLKIRNKESEVLLFLCNHYPAALSREEIEQKVWEGSYVTDNTLTQTISNLRHALDDKGHELVMTIPKKGYCLGVKPKFVLNDPSCNLSLPNKNLSDDLENETITTTSKSIGFIYKVTMLLVFFLFLFFSFKVTSYYYQVRVVDTGELPILVNLDEIHDKAFLSVYNKAPYVFLKKQKNGEYTVCKQQAGGLTCERK